MTLSQLIATNEDLRWALASYLFNLADVNGYVSDLQASAVHLDATAARAGVVVTDLRNVTDVSQQTKDADPVRLLTQPSGNAG